MKVIRITEQDIKDMVVEAIQALDKNGPYEYPEAIWDIILTAENDREIMAMKDQICNALVKHISRGEEMSVEKLMNSSVMKKFQQAAFKLARQCKINFDPRVAAPQFRQYWAERMIYQVENDDYYTGQYTVC